MMNWHWYNTTGSSQDHAAASGGNYTYWFTDSGHGTHIASSVNGGLGRPASGDNFYNESPTPSTDNGMLMGLGTGTSEVWDGVRIKAGNCLNIGQVYAAAFTLNAACVFEATATVAVGGGGVVLAAQWLGNFNLALTHDITIGTGWQCAGDVSLANTYIVYIQQPGQTNFANITITSYGIDVSAIATPILASGTVTLTYTSLAQPAAQWLTLNGASASINVNGSIIGVGHVPAVGNVLTTDNVFGVAGTATLPAAAHVLTIETAYGAGGTGSAGTYVAVAAADVRHGTAVGVSPGAGTCYVPTASQTLYGVNVDATVGNVTLPNTDGSTPNAALVLTSAHFGVSNGVVGTFDEAGRDTDPGMANVVAGVTYEHAGSVLTGTLVRWVGL
jgi:hypothetical protein